MERWSALFLALGLSCWCAAQWDVPVPVELNGAVPEDRQVTGLADPVAPDAAMSADAVRTHTTTFATASGTAVLTADLSPAPAAYTAGLLVTLVPAAANAAGAQVDLNGLGARAVVKAGGLPLDSADLAPGMPARLIYDGSRFVLLGTAYLPCPAGFHAGSREYCIEDSAHAAISWFDAVNTCVDRGARLCSYAEWVHACLVDPAFIGTVLDYEWLDDAANNTNTAKRVGNGGDGVEGTPPGINCKHGAWSIPTDTNRYRCCSNR